MRARPAPTAGSDRAGSRRELVAKILRYFTGSVVAAVCSETTFLLLYGALTTSPAVASSLGWLAGAIPNYWLNRTWTWRRRGRPSLTREILPYVAIILGTLLLAAFTTSVVDAALVKDGTSDGWRLVLVGGTFLGVYGVVFLLRFLLLDQLFRRGDVSPAPDSLGPVSAKEPV